MGKHNNKYYRHPKLIQKSIVLYPAGEYGRKILITLKELGITPVAFCDQAEEKIGTRIHGVAVRDLNDILSEYGSDAFFLVNSIRNYTVIEARLMNRGVDREHILTPSLYRYCDTGVIERPIEVTKEDAARLKECLLELLDFFHQVCEKYQIPYYLTYGTLLGAVRHGGFIPWDDDVDVAMLRKDYNRFYRVVKKELGERFVISERLNRNNLGLRSTRLREVSSDFAKVIDIDTFPVDCVFRFPNAFNKLQESASLKLYSLAEKYCWYDKQSPKHILGRVFRKCGLFVVQLCNCFHTGQTHDFEPDTRHMLADRIYEKSLIGTRVTVEFEGRKFFAPEHFHECLRRMYKDDYMELPPPETRVQSHALAELSFHN